MTRFSLKQLFFSIAFAAWVSCFAAAADDYPIPAGDVEVKLFAREPLVRNPCAITFDARGRPCVGMGPQYRSPKPDTPGDSVWILLDKDSDGEADGRKRFATGFNSIQGLAWRGSELWVANAPELTMVRDLDGDDVADEYVRVYSDLGNLEHALHGLNWGPDGRLYMSKGNSKGMTQLPGRVAPAPFRELWGVEAPGAPVFPTPKISGAADYEKTYHDPADDWGVSGGVLRCGPGGADLEIVSRGFRNPWDITFDDGFNWLGTDNDQTHGDKIFSPFYGSDFGWGHAWSYDWEGTGHLPTVPASGPLFEGSGTGVIYCGLESWPEKYRGVFFINDWLRREIYVYRPGWKGALMVPTKTPFEIFARAGGGRSLPEGGGRAFNPVDLEVGPDEALWVTSWGREYGAKMIDGEMRNEGRIYRLWPKGVRPVYGESVARRLKPAKEWTFKELTEDLGSHLPAWRVKAQEELLRRGEKVRAKLRGLLAGGKLPRALETWVVWTLGRLDPEGTWEDDNLNRHIQSLRVQALAAKPHPKTRAALKDPEPRLRLEAVLAIRQAGQVADCRAELIGLAAGEEDRLVYYAVWGALRAGLPVDEREALLGHSSAGVRRAALLGLLEDDLLPVGRLKALASDSDAPTAKLARRRLGGKAIYQQRGRPLRASVAARPALPPSAVPLTQLQAASSNSYQLAILAEGVNAYSDRQYRVTHVPDELKGETFIQTACSDAELTGGTALSFNLLYPSTVFLADDARGELPPAWLRKGWKPLDLVLHTTDAERMKIYQREYPAGRVELGANSDGVKASKGNYLVVIRPRLIQKRARPTVAGDVLPLLSSGNVRRGRDLFLGRHGATCSTCHRLEGVGNVFAPDLSDAGSRIKPELLVRSILEPSAAITEGFAMQAITKRSGQVLSGIVIGETGLAVKLAIPGGTVAEIGKKQILARRRLEISAMPVLSDVLAPQQVADLVAYLGSKKKGFSFRKEEDHLELWLDGRRITDYLLEHPQLTRRGFINVRTPGGIQVTRLFPPSGDDKDHALMHPGLWMGFGHLDGQDYWRLKARVEHDEFLKDPTATAGEASFTVRNRYLTEDGRGESCREIARYRFLRAEKGLVLLWDSEFRNDERDFYFGDQEESGLGVRVASAIRVKGGNGLIINDAGGKNGAGTWGRQMKWIDYSGLIDGRRVGILVVPSPRNPRPSWAHSRDYGVVVINPFPKQPKERREPYVRTRVKKGESFRLRYAVLIHDNARAIDRAAAAAGLLKLLGD